MTSAAESFRSWIIAQCGGDPGPIISDGRWHRFNPGDTKTRSSRPARYLLHDDDRPVGWFMDWRTGERLRWFGDSQFERINRSEINRRREARKAELEAGFDGAARNALAFWELAEPAKANGSRHPYLARKDINPHGTRVSGDRLLVPLYSSDGELRSIQSIKPDGKRRFWDGSSVAGTHFRIGDFSAGPIVLCEGFSTGASIHEATGFPIIVCIDAANMVAVSRWAGHCWPGREFVVAGDDDWHLPHLPRPMPNVGREAAEKAARNLGGRMVIASLMGLESAGGDDFNDVAREYDHAAVAEQFSVAFDGPELCDDSGQLTAEVEQPTSKKLILATPFVWRPTDQIPKRQWLYGKHLLRKFVSLDVAAGGVGKSSLKVGESLAMASGIDIYRKGLPEGPLVTWFWNLEDPADETERRIHATLQKFNIAPNDLGGRLYTDSGRDQPLVIAKDGPDGAMIAHPIVDALIAEMLERKIDVLIVDPFISSHQVSENDNNAIDLVAREWNVVAERTGAAINLVHHVRKGNGVEATADSARGASALIGKARSVLVYNRMSPDEANTLGVDQDERRFFFRVDNDKANLAPPDATDWYRMNNVDLANGDAVGVACPWTPPDLFDGVTARHLYSVQKAVSQGDWRENVQSKDAWVGHAVAGVFGLDVEMEKDRKRINRLVKAWLSEGALEVVEKQDARRETRKYVVVGKWVEL